MGLEKDIGRLEAHMQNVKKSQETLFEKIGEINKDHKADQKQIKIFLESIHTKVEGINQPCSYLKVTQKELEDHKEEHSNAIKKTAVRVTIVTVIVNTIALVLNKGQEWWHNWWFGIK